MQRSFMTDANCTTDDDGNRQWRNKKGEYHRLDGPAIEYINGHEEWWVNGRCHRLDGPAVELPGGSKQWWVDDKLHRLDGPAMEWAGGDNSWWVNYEKLTKEQFDRHPLVVFHRLTK
jgi:hypothetical protein